MDAIFGVGHYALRYYGIDWLITATVFSSIFLLGDRKKLGFVLGLFRQRQASCSAYKSEASPTGLPR